MHKVVFLRQEYAIFLPSHYSNDSRQGTLVDIPSTEKENHRVTFYASNAYGYYKSLAKKNIHKLPHTTLQA